MQSTPTIREMTRFSWKTWLVLYGLGFVGVILGVALQLIVLTPVLATPENPPPPAWVLLMAGTFQTGLLLALAMLGGRAAARRVGLRAAPLLDQWLAGEPSPVSVGRSLVTGFFSGLAAGLVMLLVYQWVFLPLDALPRNIAAEGPLWLGMAAAFLYGGVTEELLMRLFLMTGMVWLLGRWWQNAEGRPAAGAYWTAILISTVLFGLGHLPGIALLQPLTGVMVVAAVVLNSVGVLYDWLYWRYGLESAIAAHMATHITYTLLGVLVFG